MHTINKRIIRKFDKTGPRYTSYPTAPEWSDTVTDADYQEKLKDFSETQKSLSLYVHIPFCESLCYFCACSKVIRRQDEKFGDEFIDYVSKELELVCQFAGENRDVRQLHWGGGTPSYLSENQMIRLFNIVNDHFKIDRNEEISIEVDPRRVTESKVKTLRQLGFNRISIGLQDFNDDVQREVNRIQPFEDVEQFMGWCRKYEFHSINVDLIYGLPRQTRETFHKTVNQVISLKPDRIALYSYAYVPWLQKHQQKVDLSTLPDSDTKLDIFIKAREDFLNNDYDAIAMDHFALKSDELTQAFHNGTLYRNFMGYTTRPADEFIGIGPSAIGFIENSFFQNTKSLPEYYGLLKENRLPTRRGMILSENDIIRQYVIQSLMCHFHIDKLKFQQLFHKDFDKYFCEEKNALYQNCNNGLIEQTEDIINVTDLGKFFIRNICMTFDKYLRQKDAHRQFSKTI